MKAKLLRKIRAKVAWKYDHTKQKWLFYDIESMRQFTPYAGMVTMINITLYDSTVDANLFELLSHIDKMNLFKSKASRVLNRKIKYTSKEKKLSALKEWLTT